MDGWMNRMMDGCRLGSEVGGSSSESWRRERDGCVIGDRVYCYNGQFSEWRLKECQDSFPSLGFSAGERTSASVGPFARDGLTECGVEWGWTTLAPITMAGRP